MKLYRRDHFYLQKRINPGSRINPETSPFHNFVDPVKHYLSEVGVILFADGALIFLAAPSLDVLYNKIHNAVSEFLTFSQQTLLTLNFFKTFS